MLVDIACSDHPNYISAFWPGPEYVWPEGGEWLYLTPNDALRIKVMNVCTVMQIEYEEAQKLGIALPYLKEPATDLEPEPENYTPDIVFEENSML